MKLMATYGDLIKPINEKETRRIFQDPNTNHIVETTFKYVTPYSNHFQYRHVVVTRPTLARVQLHLQRSMEFHGIGQAKIYLYTVDSFIYID